MCFNWKVLAGLAAVGVGIYVVAPELTLSALPLLLLAACPLSMLFMMKGMGGMQGGQCSTPGQQAQQGQPAVGQPLSREEQLAQLRAQLQGVSEQQAALAQQIEQLQPAEAEERPATNGTAVNGAPANGRVVAEAEAIARERSAADRPPADSARGARASE